KMNTKFIRGASFTRYGTTMYVGIGIPIPILNIGLAKKTAIRDEDIKVPIVDYGVPARDRPKLGTVSYKELKSGSVTINGKKVKVSPLSSLKTAMEIAETLKSWIEEGTFYLSAPVERLPTDTEFKPMRQKEKALLVRDIAQKAVTCQENEDIREVARKIIKNAVNHVVVVNEKGELKGIVTSWDITRAVGEGKTSLPEIITRKVITARMEEPVDAAARRMAQHQISALPIIDHHRRVLGIVTSEDVTKVLGRQING
ncbi:CBS domain-containing protein, partial [Candidatus Bathyarchaeota archaeon]|nr:CBS domain-containing protein [Candidatus Bathyarchaeota archaeon]